MGRKRGEVGVTRASQDLGCCEETVRRHIKQGKITTARREYSGRYYMQRSEIRELVDRANNFDNL